MRQDVFALTGRDDVFATRLDIHVHRIMIVWLFAQFALLVGHGIADGRAALFLAHLAMLVMAAIILIRSRDCIETIIFTHVFWMFSAMTSLAVFSRVAEAICGVTVTRGCCQ